MPPRPALEPASPSEPADAATTRELSEVLFTDGEWRLVRIRARWRDSAGRLVVQVEYHAGGDTRSGSYVVDGAMMREGRGGG